MYINDYTKNLMKKLESMIYYEQDQEVQQAESFTSMVSHEMRTPLLSIVFFLNKVLNLLINENFDEANVMDMIKMCSNCIT